LANLERLSLDDESFLTGLLKEELDSFSLLSFQLGEFPLIEGLFKQLTSVLLSVDLSSRFKISS